MKAIAYLQRRHRSPTGPSISLFPFLAVLICTMGALVPLLLAISRTARLQAEAAAAAKASDVGAETQMEREMVQWRVEQLQASRTTTEGQLADARLELGHIEDHARRLRDQLSRYEQTFNDLDRLGAADGQQRAEVEDELRQMQGKIAAAERGLEETRRTASQRSPSFAVVPYEGPNQTHRRPIYLECRADCVVLQPEGIAFDEGDFEGPLGPGNPLAVALRAAREHMLSQQRADPQAGEPYPLLLVRPEGINAYYAARAAMKSWGFEFGYELVEEQWKLSYPKPDRALVDLLRPLIVSARREQAMLIAAAPREYRESKVRYRASQGHGGFVAEGDDAGDADRGYRSQTPSGRVGKNAAHGNAAPGGSRDGDTQYAGDKPYAGDRPYSGNGSAAGSKDTSSGGTGGGNASYAGDRPYTGGGFLTGSSDGTATANDASGGYPGSVGTGGNQSGGNGSGGNGTSGNFVGSSAGGGNASGGAGGSLLGASNPYEVTASAGNSDGVGGASPATAVAVDNGPALLANNGVAHSAQGQNKAAASGQGAGANGVASTWASDQSPSNSNAQPVEKPVDYVVGQPPREQVASNTSKASSEKSRPGRLYRPGEWEDPPERPPEPPKKPDKDKDDDKGRFGRKREKPVADQRGDGWGLRDSSHGATGVTRAIRVDCFADKAIVVSERGTASNKVIAFGPRTGTSIDAFISAIWEHMDAWGIAGRGMYWRPVLHVHVAPDAEQRFSDLNTLLEGSGLTVTRK